MIGVGTATAKEKPLEITIPANCGAAEIAGADVKIKKKEDDVILFRFVNRCDKPRVVVVCAVPLTSGALKPWDHCKGLEPEEPQPGTPFQIGAATTADPAITAYSLCSVAYGTDKQSFCVFPISRPMGTAITCPATYDECKRQKENRTSEIAIEVEP